MSRRPMDTSTGARLLVGLALVVAAGACADSQVTAPDVVVPDLPTTRNLVMDPVDPLTETHTFDELPQTCMFGDTIPNPYEGLTFETKPYLSACPSPNGTAAVLPSNPYTYGSITELVIDLPKAAVSARLDVYDVAQGGNVTLNAYDGSGNLVASASDTAANAWVTLSVAGDIARLGIASDQGNAYLDNLTLTYAPDKPTDANACKRGGWSAFGFKNQGQCVRFVETGKDSR